eukprot:1926622-Alexandrium_andersonii.AAC.1
MSASLVGSEMCIRDRPEMGSRWSSPREVGWWELGMEWRCCELRAQEDLEVAMEVDEFKGVMKDAVDTAFADIRALLKEPSQAGR